MSASLTLAQQIENIISIVRINVQSGSFQCNFNLKDTKLSTYSKIFLYVIMKRDILVEYVFLLLCNTKYLIMFGAGGRKSTAIAVWEDDRTLPVNGVLRLEA